jgi:uncharacterized protein (DUF1330 family)
MPKAYWINCFRRVEDPQKLLDYAALAGPAMRAAGGRFLARGQPAHVFEQGLRERVTIIEFDSVAQAISAYESPAYQEALQILGDSAERDMRIVEGTDE